MKNKEDITAYIQSLRNMYPADLPKGSDLVKEGMESAYQMKVELKAEGTYAKNWYELK